MSPDFWGQTACLQRGSADGIVLPRENDRRFSKLKALKLLCWFSLQVVPRQLTCRGAAWLQARWELRLPGRSPGMAGVLQGCALPCPALALLGKASQQSCSLCKSSLMPRERNHIPAQQTGDLKCILFLWWSFAHPCQSPWVNKQKVFVSSDFRYCSEQGLGLGKLRNGAEMAM